MKACGTTQSIVWNPCITSLHYSEVCFDIPNPINNFQTTGNVCLKSPAKRKVIPVSYTHLDVYKRQI